MLVAHPPVSEAAAASEAQARRPAAHGEAQSLAYELSQYGIIVAPKQKCYTFMVNLATGFLLRIVPMKRRRLD